MSMDVVSFFEKIGDKILSKIFKINIDEEKARYISAVIDTPQELKITNAIWSGLTESEKKEVFLHNFEEVQKGNNAEAGLIFVLLPVMILFVLLKYYL